MRPAYYNEIDPFAVEWLRNLIRAGHLPAGDVDVRPIQEVTPDDLARYAQCHFFAGVGGWALALRLAGWPDDRPVWTGSCPCQPFSVAGKGEAAKDPRHLWPDWFRLVRAARPPLVFGEQVSGAIRHGWWDLVSTDLEGEGYAVRAVVLGAHSVGAPHIRQRLYFAGRVADDARVGRGTVLGLEDQPGRGRDDGLGEVPAPGDRAARGVGDAQDAERRSGECGAEAGARPDRERGWGPAGAGATRVVAEPEPVGRGGRGDGHPAGGAGGAGPEAEVAGSGPARVVADAGRDEPGRRDTLRDATRGAPEAARGREGAATDRERAEPDAADDGAGRGVADADRGRCEVEREPEHGDEGAPGGELVGHRADGRFPWTHVEWIPCRDGKWRPTQPGLFPLADGVPGRMGRLRAYGNAIVPQVAAEFVRDYL